MAGTSPLAIMSRGINWRNRENHYAYEIESERLPDALHGAVALYLFAAMVNAEKFNYIEG